MLLSPLLFAGTLLASSSVFTSSTVIVDLPQLAVAQSSDEDECEANGWYGDETCDEGCPKPDPDCEKMGNFQGDTAADECEANGWYGDGMCDEDCPNVDPDCTGAEAEEDDPCVLYRSYNDGVCDDDCFQPDPDCASGGQSASSLAPAIVPMQRSSATAAIPACPNSSPVRCLNGTCVSKLVDCADQPSASAGSSAASQALSANDAQDDEILQAYVAQLKSQNTSITDVSFQDGILSVSAARSARILWMIAKDYVLTIHVQGTDISSSAPFWLFVASDDASSVISDVRSALAEQADAVAALPTDLMRAQFTLQVIDAVLRTQ
ncbi:TPA: hypothetical protein DCL30_03005 [Candidatus Peribacteria bacterium]|nr:MAG: hypothetical protein A3J91_00255 [Candidatus Peribacteria bacterium RIFOXYC2_FULL_58_10]OGJ83812.1 MAG: hypothetical protein A2529_05705 [Candidatus Peribacteria bacterium RIFOXYD2_FULL_58_15]HAI98488.1 hypothetical protein [Candidatus Peribacteria bacterium]HAS34200.1 hypothetical protein [Candidatus Peribacteria bacterium]